jgi:NAD(P)-dependent dehydrogenase (short-subunit alcohol dehydrogenase family)
MRVMLADVEEPALAAAAAALAAEGIETAATVVDVSDADSVQSLATATLDRFGTVHVVCNNAGVAPGVSFSWELPMSTWNWIMGVNFFGVVHGIRAFLPHLIAQSEGHIVNTASIFGLLAMPWVSSYSASKHAVVAVSECLHGELASVGSPVGVSVLCPGFVRTKLSEADRNRPAWDRAAGEEQADLQQIQDAGDALIAGGTDLALVAAAVRDAIIDQRFWILTHPEFNDPISARFSGALEGRNPETVPLA